LYISNTYPRILNWWLCSLYRLQITEINLQASRVILNNISKRKFKSDDATKKAVVRCSWFNFAQESTQQDITESFQCLTHFCTQTSLFYPNDRIYGFCFPLSYSKLTFHISHLFLKLIFCCQFHVVLYTTLLNCRRLYSKKRYFFFYMHLTSVCTWIVELLTLGNNGSNSNCKHSRTYHSILFIL